MTFKHTLGALVLALALPAGAQAPAPAPAPGATPQQQPTAPQAGAQGLDAPHALSAVWIINQHHAGLGDLAAARGKSDEVKKFARSVSDEAKKWGSQLSPLLQKRGLNPATLPAPPEKQQVEADAKDLAGRSGEDFDRAFTAHMKKIGPWFVDALKRARDLTPGKDAELKKLLDTMEDGEENYLTQARQLEGRRSQARTPPAR
jgi:putative membrane protein